MKEEQLDQYTREYLQILVNKKVVVSVEYTQFLKSFRKRRDICKVTNKWKNVSVNRSNFIFFIYSKTSIFNFLLVHQNYVDI